MSACIRYGSISTSIRAGGSEQLLHPPVYDDDGDNRDTDKNTDHDSHDNDDDSYGMDHLREELLQRAKKFDLPVSPEKGYRATQLNLFSFSRPHMRAFHGSWMCFCCAWLVWFSIVPLLPAISETIPMTKSDIWTTNIAALVGTIFLRLILGPLCDQYGGRGILTSLLAICAIPLALSGLLIYDYKSLLMVRFLIGCVGGTLVPAQFWITSHFTPECSGVAMATAAGWGALGGGLAQILMGSLLFPFCEHYVTAGDTDLAWRLALVFPACLAAACAYFFYAYADDSPLGSYTEVKQAGLLQQRSAVDSFRSGIFNLNAWILFVQFGASLGIELTMESGMTLHLSERFDLTVAHAAALASLFGFMNIFARGLGGLISDRLHQQYSLRGRLMIQMILLFSEGILILLFIRSDTLSHTLTVMVLFAATGQMCMGTCFGIVPYLDPRSTGTIVAIVAAGGNVGAVLFSNCFRTQPDDYAFYVMGVACCLSALLTPLIVVAGYKGILFGREPKTGPGGVQTLWTPAHPISA
jgi:NNP family nitrate/nitrite transporter-like MFS transporter